MSDETFKVGRGFGYSIRSSQGYRFSIAGTTGLLYVTADGVKKRFNSETMAGSPVGVIVWRDSIERQVQDADIVVDRLRRACAHAQWRLDLV
jgi:hypothetical protein